MGKRQNVLIKSAVAIKRFACLLMGCGFSCHYLPKCEFLGRLKGLPSIGKGKVPYPDVPSVTLQGTQDNPAEMLSREK